MTTDRKRRSDAWEQQLTEEQQAIVRDRMRRFPWHAVSPWIAEEFGIPAPGKSALYAFAEWFDDHEEEFMLRQRIRDGEALTRELKAVGAPDPENLVAALGNDVVSARAKGDDQAVERAVRIYKSLAKVVGDTKTFTLKVKEFDQAQRDFELKKQDMDIKLRRLELIEHKLADASATGATVDPKALAEEIDRILGRKQS